MPNPQSLAALAKLDTPFDEIEAVVQKLEGPAPSPAFSVTKIDLQPLKAMFEGIDRLSAIARPELTSALQTSVLACKVFWNACTQTKN